MCTNIHKRLSLALALLQIAVGGPDTGTTTFPIAAETLICPSAMSTKRPIALVEYQKLFSPSLCSNAPIFRCAESPCRWGDASYFQ